MLTSLPYVDRRQLISVLAAAMLVFAMPRMLNTRHLPGCLRLRLQSRSKWVLLMWLTETFIWRFRLHRFRSVAV